MKLAFIGTGNMGRAILEGVIRRQVAHPDEISLFDTDFSKVSDLAARTGAKASDTAVNAVKDAEVVILATKPDACAKALQPIRSVLLEKQVLISIAAGMTLSNLRHLAGSAPRLVRAMPNTPALVGCGATALALEGSDDTVRDVATAIFASLGDVAVIPEKLMDAVTGLSGSGPAFMMMVIEAMADAGVYLGLTRDLALQLAAKTMEGSARLCLDTRQHPGVLKDQVCSPGGTTIEGVRALEEGGLRAAIISAVTAAAEKSARLQRQAQDAGITEASTHING